MSKNTAPAMAETDQSRLRSRTLRAGAVAGATILSGLAAAGLMPNTASAWTARATTARSDSSNKQFVAEPFKHQGNKQHALQGSNLMPNHSKATVKLGWDYGQVITFSVDGKGILSSDWEPNLNIDRWDRHNHTWKHVLDVSAVLGSVATAAERVQAIESQSIFSESAVRALSPEEQAKVVHYEDSQVPLRVSAEAGAIGISAHAALNQQPRNLGK